MRVEALRIRGKNRCAFSALRVSLQVTLIIDETTFLKHENRLERTYSVFLIQVRETQVFVCARATLDRRIALDLKRVVGF